MVLSSHISSITVIATEQFKKKLYRVYRILNYAKYLSGGSKIEYNSVYIYVCVCVCFRYDLTYKKYKQGTKKCYNHSKIEFTSV